MTKGELGTAVFRTSAILLLVKDVRWIIHSGYVTYVELQARGGAGMQAPAVIQGLDLVLRLALIIGLYVLARPLSQRVFEYPEAKVPNFTVNINVFAALMGAAGAVVVAIALAGLIPSFLGAVIVSDQSIQSMNRQAAEINFLTALFRLVIGVGMFLWSSRIAGLWQR